MHRPPPLLRPRALGPGARVALVAPAGPVEPERIDRSARRCRELDLEPVVFPAASARHPARAYLAGTDDARLADLQAAFDNPAIDAVWALRGGYGTQRITDRLDLGRQRRAPIPFIGFSDNTTLHVRHAALGVISFHGPHPGGDFPTETEQSFYNVLFAAESPGVLPTRATDPAPHALVPGAVEARLAGGNLSMLASLCGTPDAPASRDRILFLEDVGEPAYRVDRMLVQLRRAGVLDGVAGLALGRFTDEGGDADPGEVTGGGEDDARGGPGAPTSASGGEARGGEASGGDAGRGEARNGKASGDEARASKARNGAGGRAGAVAGVLQELARELGVPTVVDLPFGHVEHNCTLPVGARALLDADAATLSLTEPAVTARP